MLLFKCYTPGPCLMRTSLLVLANISCTNFTAVNLNIMTFFTKVLNFHFCMIRYPLQVVTRCSNWNTKILLRTCCSRQKSNSITDFFSDRITKPWTKVGTTIHRIYSRNARLDVCRTSSFIAKVFY